MPGRRRKRRAHSRQPAPNTHEEPRSAVAANVLWMLTLLATVIAETVGLACQLYLTFVGPSPVTAMFAGTMLFIALVSGIVTLLVTPVVLAVSTVKPPNIIVATAIVAGVLPILALLFQYVR